MERFCGEKERGLRRVRQFQRRGGGRIEWDGEVHWRGGTVERGLVGSAEKRDG